MDRRAKSLKARSRATRDAAGTVRTIATAAWIEGSIKAATVKATTDIVLTDNGRSIEVAVITRRGILLEARHFATMEHTAGARAPAIARDDRVGELGILASSIVLAVHGALLNLKLGAAIISSAVIAV